MDGKTKAIVAHLTFVGLIISAVLNNSEKDEYASFYNRQQLGLNLACLILAVVFPILGTILAIIPILGWIAGALLGLLSFVLGIAVFVFWIISLIGCLQDEQKEVPFVGSYFQEWFKAL